MIVGLLLGVALAAGPVDLRPQDPFENPNTALRAQVLQPPPPPADSQWGWTVDDTVREAVVLTLIAADWRQTRAFRADGLEEQNPILGRRPSRARVNFLIGAAMVLHPVAARAMPRPWRQVFQTVTVVDEAIAVGHNWALGYPPIKLK